MASVFEVPVQDAMDISVNYVGVLKDILKLDYGPLYTPIIIFRCQWMKTSDNRGRPTYIRDDAGFLIVNFRHKLPHMSDPFIFSSQATQVFFSHIPSKLGWKVVLQKQARARREVLDTSDVFITTTVETPSITTSGAIVRPSAISSLIGVVELSTDDNLLAHVQY